MASFSKFKRQLETAVKKVTKVDAWPATVVRAGTAPARSVVKFTNGLELEVLNYRFSSVADLKVSVGYDPLLPDVLQVLGIRESINLIGQASSWSFWLPEHHANHEFPNPDTVWVHGAQFVPLNVVPVSGLTVRIYGSVLRGDGEWVAFQTETLDLTSHQPATGALYALIELDETGAAVVTDGATKDSRFSLTAADIPEPTAGRTPICAIRLYDGQTKIYHDVRVGKPNDVTDLRWNRYANGGLADLAKDLDIANLPVEASPTSGDKLVIDRAGVRSQIDWDDLPAGGGGANWSDIDSATADTPLDADKFGFWDVVDAALKSITWANIKATLKTYFDTLYAAVANGVTNGDSHDHNGGDGAQIAHGNLSGIGTNTHAQVDAHIASVANPHNVTAVQAGAQPVDAGLTSLSAFPTVADRIVYSTAADTWAETPLTAAVRTLLDDATVAAMRTTLNAAGLADANDFTATQTVKVADNTKAIVLTDDSDVEWLSIKRVGNTVTLDVPSVEPVNKLINPTFDTDLSSWSEIMSYILNDQFTTDRAAGAVNGTSAEPTGGTRTVNDTDGDALSISGGTLVSANPNSSWGNPGIWYPAITRAAGLTLIGTIQKSGSAYAAFGFFPSVPYITQPTTATVGFRLNAGASKPFVANPDGGQVAELDDGTYNMAIVLRTTGAFYYIKGGSYTNWTLLSISSLLSTATLYPGISEYNNAFPTADNIRIPTSTWLPTPLAYDTFTRADGAIGSSETTGPDGQTTPSLAWTGGAISTNKNVITPSLGSELLSNNTFDTDTGWTKDSGWTIGGGVATGTSVSGGIYQTVGNVGTWYQIAWDLVSRTAGSASARFGAVDNLFRTVPGSYIDTRRITSGINSGINGSSFSGTVDNVYMKPLTLSSLFSSVSTSDTDVIADANVTLTAGTQAGIVTNLDSTSSPANFLIAYHDGTNVKLDKNVGGTYTNLISAAATYSAGATLRVITYTSSGSLKVRVYYNNALVGSEQTVSDAGIISNTKHGLFSTYSGNSFDNFTLWARGTGAEYTSAPFEELTVTRDTTTKYEGAASAKLVAGGTDGNYLQSVNVGDTATYNLYCYAYTTGAAVTSADVELYYDGAVLSTSYTDMGGGWYKLSSSLTGVASAKDFGVRVKAGKTVYCDSFSLQAGSGATTILKILNGGTGLLLLQLADGLPEYADNAAAVAAGLAVGVTYRTGDVVKIVH